MEQRETPVRLSQLIAALSLASDLGMGQPMEHALVACVLTVRAGEALAVPAILLSDAYYLALLRFIGCTADAHETALEVGGDEIGMRAVTSPVMMGGTAKMLRAALASVGREQAPWSRLRLRAAFLAGGRAAGKRHIAEHCEVARMLVTQIGLPARIGDHVGRIYERWDGKGLPGELTANEIPLPCRLVAVATDAAPFYRRGGWSLAASTLSERRAKAYDPAVADLFLEHGRAWLEATEHSAWDAAQAAEPPPHRLVTGESLTTVLEAFADFADLKSPFNVGHSRGVADLAERAARVSGLGDAGAQEVRHAALVHDLGKTAVPNGILDKPGPLAAAEWERVRLHPYYTERILSYAPPLFNIAKIAGAHHERLDGSGYHRGVAAGAIAQSSRLLAAADVYDALGRARSYHQSLPDKDRQAELVRAANEGRLDYAAVRSVLEAAGAPAGPPRMSHPAGLSEREVEVLRLISTGHSNREVAGLLTISPKTVGRHVENIYAKTGVSTRATVALFAMQNDLL